MKKHPAPLLKFATKSAPLHKRLGNAQKAGFHHAELFLNSTLLENWKDVADIAGDHNLSYGLHFPNRAPLTRKHLKKAVKLYHRLNCESMVIHRPMFRLYAPDLLNLDPELYLAVENHRLNPQNFWHWAENYQWLTLDVEHLWKYTLKQAPLPTFLFTLKKFLKRHGHQVRRVHLPGYEPGSKEHRPIHSNPRLGRKVFTALAKINYQGLVVSETRPALQTPELLRKDVRFYQSWQKKRLAKIKK
ncbi:MAG: hypothetical protein QM496_00865 [Verrucomicrobiota bacterium]